MTNYIILLYLAGVADGFHDVIEVLIFADGAILFILSGAILISHLPPVDEDQQVIRDSAMRPLKPVAIAMTVLLLLKVAVPNKDFLYLVTGLNATEDAVELVNRSETASKAQEVLNAWLDKKLEELKK